MSLEELKKAIKEKKLTFGTNQTMKKLRLSKLNTVFLASNCSSKVRDDIKHYAKLADAKVIELDIPDYEIGTVCKKRHSVAVLSY
ncbi:MAG: ribosomal L7Ae/L30e/S12e/Gadd45 family protein [Candidatus Woesearchaeota archaeon]